MSKPGTPVDRTIQRVRVGIGGWTYAPWRNNFYPDQLVQRGELEYASRQLRAIEVNGTFYRTQKPATYAKLPHVVAVQATTAPRDVFAFFIGAAKHRNPAAMALQSRVDAAA